MEIKISENKKCEHCGELATPDMNTCFNCRKRLVHEDVQSFIKKLQEAQEATRKHNTHFGPLPNEDKSLIKTIRTTPEQMNKVIKDSNTVVRNIPSWNSRSNPKSILMKHDNCDVCGYDQKGTRVCPICYQRLLKELREANIKLDKLKEVLYEDIPLEENLKDIFYQCKDILNK